MSSAIVKKNAPDIHAFVALCQKQSALTLQQIVTSLFEKMRTEGIFQTQEVSKLYWQTMPRPNLEAGWRYSPPQDPEKCAACWEKMESKLELLYDEEGHLFALLNRQNSNVNIPPEQIHIRWNNEFSELIPFLSTDGSLYLVDPEDSELISLKQEPSAVWNFDECNTICEALKNFLQIYGHQRSWTVERAERFHRCKDAVCRLVYPGGTGTGFVIGNRLIITNHHVLSDPAKQVVAEFFYDDEYGNETVRVDLDPDTFFVTSKSPDMEGDKPLTKDMLDFTIVAIKDHPKLREVFKHPILLEKSKTKTAQKDQNILVIHHPLGKKKMISLAEDDKNRIIQVTQLYFVHTALTDSGSSGSPILTQDLQLIGLHRRALGANPQHKAAIKVDAIRSYLIKIQAWGKILKEFRPYEHVSEAAPHTSLVQNHSFDEIFKNLDLFFMAATAETSEEQMRKSYAELHSIFPQLTADNLRRLHKNAFHAFALFPKLVPEQLTLTLDFASWHLNHDHMNNAMFYYSQSVKMAGIHHSEKLPEIHYQTSKLFMKKIRSTFLDSGKFKKDLENAKGQGDVVSFKKVLDNLQQLKSFCCDAEDDKILKKLYEQAAEVLSESRFEDKQPIAALIQEKLKKNRTDYRPFTTERYLLALKNFRKKFEIEIIPQSKVREFQKEIQANFIEFFSHTFLKDALAMSGSPPCEFDMRAMGSFASGEACAYSGLEWFILIREAQHANYFRQLASIVELQIASLGETAASDLPVFTSLNSQPSSGLHIKSWGSPAQDERLISTPEDLARLQKYDPNSNNDLLDQDPCQIQNTLRNSVSLYSSTKDLFQTYDVKIKEYLDKEFHNQGKVRQAYANALLKARFESYEDVFVKPLEKLDAFNIKTHLLELITFAVQDLGLFFDAMQCHPMETMESLGKKGVLTPYTVKLFQEALVLTYRIRLRAHQFYHEQKEDIYRCPQGLKFEKDLRVCYLEADDVAALNSIYWLVLRPCYQIIPNGLEEQTLPFDLLANGFQEHYQRQNSHDFQSYLTHLISFLLTENAPEKEFQKYYEMLSQQIALSPLRSFFLGKLNNQPLIDSLANIPNRAGFRESHRLDEEFLQHALLAVTTDIPSVSLPRVAVQLTFHDKPRYLKEELVKQILKADGHLQKQYQDSLHQVARGKYENWDFHFKENPSHPMMEYAIHNFTFRMMGKATPSTTLARFTVQTAQRECVYPVLISQTIQGVPLSHNHQVNSHHLTWFLLCAILFRPGDGRHSNYLIDKLGKIMCHDNDIHFVEPIAKQRSHEKVQFSSTLFNLYPELQATKKVLEAFISLDFQIILNDALEDLINKEKEYTQLFPTSTSDFTPFLLLREGTIMTLCLQFNHLKNVLQEKLQKSETIRAIDLLSMLVTLRAGSSEQMLIGPKVMRAYLDGNSRSSDPKERLKIALNASIQKSMTTADARQASLGKIPSLEEIDKRKLYSLTQARGELLSLDLKNVDQGVSLTKKGDQTTLHVYFDKMLLDNEEPDSDRQAFIFKGLEMLFSQGNPLPETITFANCNVLNSTTLSPFLHNKIKYLDLRLCPQLADNDLVMIASKCPQLEELYVSGCKGLKNICNYNYLLQASPLEFPKLRILHIARCDLKFLSVKAPQLQELKANDNSGFQLGELFNHTLHKVKVDFSISNRNSNSSVTLDGDLHPPKMDLTIQTFKGHQGLVRALIQLKDGTIVSGSNDTTIKYWDQNGKCLKTLEGHEHSINALIELKDGTVVSCSWDHTIKFWDKDGRCIMTLGTPPNVTRNVSLKSLKLFPTEDEHYDSVNVVIELADGTLASGSRDSTLKLWNRSGKCLKTLRGYGNEITCLIELKNGDLACGSLDGTIRIWSREGKLLEIIKEEENKLIPTRPTSSAIYALLELNGGFIITGSMDGQIKIWKRQHVGCLGKIQAHNNVINVLLLSHDGRLVSGSADGKIRLWPWPNDLTTILDKLNDPQTFLRQYPPQTLRGGYGSILIQLKDDTLVSGSNDNTLKLWSF